MTEPQPERDALEIVNLTAETLGRDMLQALVQHLQGMRKGWEQYTGAEQQQILDQLKSKVRHVITEGLFVLFRGQFPACPATLDSIQVKQGLQVKLKIAKGARSWHEVIDAEGSQVLLVMADPEVFAERMDEIRAQADQKDLFQGNYQPGEGPYRRDRPAIPPEVSWSDIRDKMNEGNEGPVTEGELAFGEAAEQPAEPAPEKSIQEQAREFLAQVFCFVDKEIADRWTEQECAVAAYWAIEYAKNPDTAPARPHWLPLPQPPESQASGDEPTAAAEGDEPESLEQETATDDDEPELEQDPDDQLPEDPETSDDESDEPATA